MNWYRVGLIGDPVAHSRSPAMHNAAFAHLGIAATYERWFTSAADLPQRVASLRDPAIWGANVTLPHKTAVLNLLDEVEPQAARIGAVNTIYKAADGALIGANTDAPGFVEALREDGGFDPAGQQVVILGASGAARAAVYGLLAANVRCIVLANRSLARAEHLLADVLSDYIELPADPAAPLLADVLAETDQTGRLYNNNGAQPLPEPAAAATAGVAPDEEDDAPVFIALTLDDEALPELIATSTLLVNATSIGWHAEETPLHGLVVPAGMLVYDMVYRPTRLLHMAAAQGARTLDGSGMLLRQGALAFSRWTQQPAPLDIMRQALWGEQV